MIRITWQNIKKIKKIKAYRKAYKNWFTVLLSLVILGKAKAITRDDKKIEGDVYVISVIPNLLISECCQLVDIAEDLSYITIELEGKKARVYEWTSILFNLMTNDYLPLNVKDRSVLDIGAFVGDTTIYFNLRGAKRIVAIEASPWAFQAAKRNIEANKMSNVTLINCAIDKEDGKKLKLPLSKTTGTFSPKRVEGKGDIEVPTCTLDSIIEKYGPFDVLKMDCEGCEYDSIPYSNRLGEFKEILIEYHNGYDILVKKLKSEGFKLQFSKTEMGKKYYDYPIDEREGLIYAIKQ